MMVRTQYQATQKDILQSVDEYKNRVQPGLLKSVQSLQKVGDLIRDGAVKDKNMRDAKASRMASSVTVSSQPEAAALASPPEAAALASPPLAPPGSTLLDFDVQLSASKRGRFTVLVHPEWAPLGAERLIELVKLGFFAETRFFRVVSGFVVQWGISGDPATSSEW